MSEVNYDYTNNHPNITLLCQGLRVMSQYN